MMINEPEITIDELDIPLRFENTKDILINKFYSDCFQIIDGFEKEGDPCIVMIN